MADEPRIVHEFGDGDDRKTVALSGKASGGGGKSSDKGTAWCDTYHPDRPVWATDERRQRASYVATRRALVPFLVPHRFEGDVKPHELPRSRYGYAVRLNAGYLSDILGHVRTAPASYEFGDLEALADGEGSKDAPTDSNSPIFRVWQNATRDEMTWRAFFERKVLEWLLSSLGGFVLVDAPPRPDGEPVSRADAERLGLRPYLSFVPWSNVYDFETDDSGFRWVRMKEWRAERDVTDTEHDGTYNWITYKRSRDEGGNDRLEVIRHDPDGEEIERFDLDPLYDRSGDPTLPLIPVRYGRHATAEHAGAGLLAGLDDLVIDLFNVVSETRESFRDAAFSMVWYRGNDYDKVFDAMDQGSRLVPLGTDEKSAVGRLNGDKSEVDAGLALITQGLGAWAQSARGKSADAMMRSDPESGAARKTGFQVELRPLLVEVTETLDEVESEALNLVAQFLGLPANPDVAVTRDTEFDLEPETARISRLVRGFVVEAGMPLPAAAKVRIARRFLEASGLLDFSEVVEGEEGEETLTLGEVVEDELFEIAEAERRKTIQASQNPGPLFGAAG